MINLSLSQTGDAGPDFTLSADWDTQIAPKEVREVFEQAFETIGEHIRPKPRLKQEFGAPTGDYQPAAHGPLAGAKARIRDLLKEDEQGKGETLPGDLREAQELVQHLRRRMAEKDADLAIRRQNVADLSEQRDKALERLGEVSKERGEALMRAGRAENELASTLRRLDECRGEREAALNERDTVRRQLGDIAEIAEKLQSEFTEYKALKKRREANYKNRIKGLTEELAEDRAATAKAIDAAKQQIVDEGPEDALITKFSALQILGNIPQFGKDPHDVPRGPVVDPLDDPVDDPHGEPGDA